MPLVLRDGGPDEGFEGVVPLTANLEAVDKGGSVQELTEGEEYFWGDAVDN